MLLTPSSMLSIYPFVYKSLPYKPLEDVQPVSLACYFNHAFGVGPAVPESVKNIKDFLAWAKANPTKANYGSPGAGSMPHLIVGLLNKLTGSDLKHIPTAARPPASRTCWVGRSRPCRRRWVITCPTSRAASLRLLAISGTNRSPFVPDVPTYRQQGYPITVREWYGVFLPGKASGCRGRRAAAYLQPALAQPDLISSMAQVGMEVQSSSPQVLGDLLRADAEEWRRLIKQIGFTAES
jgi:tripartite-type tricarboxylate transporter receptor subunit TctC